MDTRSCGVCGEVPVFHIPSILIMIDAEFELASLFTNFHLPSVSATPRPSEMLDPPQPNAADELLRRPPYPMLPVDSIYTSCYCEENIYLLAQAFYEQPSLRAAWEIFVVFISNHTKTVCVLRTLHPWGL